MLFVVMARYRDGLRDRRLSLAAEFSDHLESNKPRIRLGGLLKGAAGEETGVFYVMEADSRQGVDAFVQSSPYQRAGLYDHVEVDAFSLEAGNLS